VQPEKKNELRHNSGHCFGVGSDWRYSGMAPQRRLGLLAERWSRPGAVDRSYSAINGQNIGKPFYF
jgi:hypothetical protein